MANKISGNLVRICPRKRYTNRTDLNLGEKERIKKKKKKLLVMQNALKTCSIGITRLLLTHYQNTVKLFTENIV